MHHFHPRRLLGLATWSLALCAAAATAEEAPPSCFAPADASVDPRSQAETVERSCSDIIAGLESLLAREPAETTTLASAYNNRASARQQLADLEGAAADYGRALDLMPSSWAVYLNRGNLMLLSNQPAAALADFQEAERLFGGPLPAAAFNSTWAHRAQGNIEAAEISLRAALSEQGAGTP